jgi:hypothetical protein
MSEKNQIVTINLKDDESSYIEILEETYLATDSYVEGFDKVGDKYRVPWSSILYIYIPLMKKQEQ